MTTTPLKALNLIRAETGNWDGTFTEGCGHSMLSSGLMSPDANRANPGGFTVFMFHPKTVGMGTKAFDSKMASLREYFGVDVDDSTIAYYAKQGYFHPTNSHDLKIQLQTAKNMLELLTCRDSIATKGLTYILDPNRWCNLATMIYERFQSEPSFGSKFLYSVDRALQTFFERMTSSTPVSEADGPQYLVYKARKLMDKVSDGETLTIALPKVLTATAREPLAKKAKTATTAVTKTKATTKRPKATAVQHSSKEHINDDAHTAWLVPEGVDYLSLFKNRAPGAKNWPKFYDSRLVPNPKTRQPRAASLYVRFQMTGTVGCTLAHVPKSEMTVPEFQQADRIIMEALAAKTTAP